MVCQEISCSSSNFEADEMGWDVMMCKFILQLFLNSAICIAEKRYLVEAYSQVRRPGEKTKFSK